MSLHIFEFFSELLVVLLSEGVQCAYQTVSLSPQQICDRGSMLSNHHASIAKMVKISEAAYRPYWKRPCGEKICLITL